MRQFNYWDFLGLLSVIFIIEMYAIELIIKIFTISSVFDLYIGKLFLIVFILYGILYLIGIAIQTGYELKGGDTI
jgi:hypothetical protein